MTSCFAVGSYVPSGSFASQTLTERWDGSSWTVVASLNLPSQYASSLVSVSCASPTNCVAVGTDLIEQWDGSSWSMAAGPNPVGSVDNVLLHVSCASTTSCFAVGYVGFSSTYSGAPKTLIEQWDGTTWSIVPSPNPTSKFGFGDSLTGVSCTSPTSCFAVGRAGSDILMERWNGTALVGERPPEAPGGRDAGRRVVYEHDELLRRREQGDHRGTEPTLTERWNGTSWSLVNSPNVSNRNSLSDVSCASTAACVAVGSYDLTSANESLAELWNGTSWSITAPLSGASQSRLLGTSCVSATFCFAVGDYITGSGARALVERWNGTTWSIVATPKPAGSQSTSLASVSCSSAKFCFAVGSEAIGNGGRPVTERWNGSTWSVVPSPLVDSLASVSCVNPTMCFAVGYSVTDLGAETLIERWNGTKWSINSLENHSGFNNYLLSVSCANATNCAAVGFVGSDLADAGLLEHWNGKTWSVVFGMTKNTSSPPVDMTGVSCVGAKFCIAVGSVTKRWNGKTWSKIASAGGGSVSCVSATYCLAVGGAVGLAVERQDLVVDYGPEPRRPARRRLLRQRDDLCRRR